MRTSNLSRFGAPFCKIILVGLSCLLMVNAVLLLIGSISYPYLVDFYYDDLYLYKSKPIQTFYIVAATLAVLVSVSTCIATAKSTTYYTLIHSGITSIVVPIIITIYLTTSSSRYSPLVYNNDYKNMISDYRISASLYRNESHYSDDHNQNGDSENIEQDKESIERLHTFTNNMDKIQLKFKCCGIDSAINWINEWGGYIPPSCCSKPNKKVSETWREKFLLPEYAKNFEFEYCEKDDTYTTGCVTALIQDETNKFDNLHTLTVVMTIALVINAICSLLMFGFIKSENVAAEHRGSMVELALKPRPSQPTITSIRPRPSIQEGATLGSGAVNVMRNGIIVNSDEKKLFDSRARAARFSRAMNTPLRHPITGASRFSAAARRDSSFL